jgi:ribosomal protein L21E
MLNVACSKFYNPSEHLAIDEVIVLFKVKDSFKQYIPKKHKRFGIKIYKLSDRTGHTYDMEVYLGKDRKRVITDMTVTHATVKQLTRRVQGRGHKLYMDNYFSSPDLYNDLTKQKINCCGTV